MDKIKIPEIKIPKLNLKSEIEAIKELKQINDLSESVKEEIGENLKNIKEYEKKFKDRWEFEGDSDYYMSICFESSKDRIAFCEKYGINSGKNYVMYNDLKIKSF